MRFHDGLNASQMGSETGSLSVSPRITGSKPCIGMSLNSLATAKSNGSNVRPDDLMPVSDQLLDDRVVDSRFDGDSSTAHQPPAWRIQCLLRILSGLQASVDELQMSLSLHWATHHAKGHLRSIRPRHEAWDDRVKRSCRSSDATRVPGFRIESSGSILHGYSGSIDDDTTAESLEVGLDERHHAPIGIRGGEIDGRTPFGPWKHEIARA